MRLVSLFWLLFVVGWGINAYKFIVGLIALPHLADVSGALIARGIGCLTGPIGSLMGLFWW